MIIKTDLIKPACATILSAVDSADVSMITETLEIVSSDNVLYLNVTNREYFTQVKVQIDECIDFHATVNATLFLKLIPQITTEEIVDTKTKIYSLCFSFYCTKMIQRRMPYERNTNMHYWRRK